MSPEAQDKPEPKEKGPRKVTYLGPAGLVVHHGKELRIGEVVNLSKAQLDELRALLPDHAFDEG